MRARRGTDRQHAKRFEQRLRRLWLLVSRWGMIAFCVSVPLAGGAAALATLSARGVHRAATSGWHQARNDQRDGDDRSYERHRRHERRERHERHRHRGRENLGAVIAIDFSPAACDEPIAESAAPGRQYRGVGID